MSNQLKAWITLTEATSWVALGDRRKAEDVLREVRERQQRWHARTAAWLIATLEVLCNGVESDEARKWADRLKADMNIASDNDLLAKARAEHEQWQRDDVAIASAQAALLEAARAGRLDIQGRPGLPHEDGTPSRLHVRVPLGFLLSAKEQDIQFGHDNIGLWWLDDRMRRHIAQNLPRRDDPDRYHGVQCRAAEVAALVAERAATTDASLASDPARAGATPAARGAHASWRDGAVSKDERIRLWLLETIRAGWSGTFEDWHREAATEFDVSERAFREIWDQHATAAMRKPGRKRRSMPEIVAISSRRS